MNVEANQANPSFGQYIWQARQQKQLTQRQLASMIGVNYTYLSKLENDRAEPSEKVIRLLAKYLELNPEELMYLAGKISQSDSEALEEFLKINYKQMPALFYRFRENLSVDLAIQARDEKIIALQRENAALKTQVCELEKKIAMKDELWVEIANLIQYLQDWGQI